MAVTETKQPATECSDPDRTIIVSVERPDRLGGQAVTSLECLHTVGRDAIQVAISRTGPNDSVRSLCQRSNISPSDLNPKLPQLTSGPTPKAALVSNPDPAIATRQQGLHAMNGGRS